jgi:hypothetical protein
LTREQAKTHPNRNVIKRFLGGAPSVEVDHRLVLEPGQLSADARLNQGARLQPGDTVLLCSDGLSDMIDDAAILHSLQRHFHALDVAVDELIDKANAAGGKDNITAVIMQVPGGQNVVLPLPLSTPANARPTGAARAVTAGAMAARRGPAAAGDTAAVTAPGNSAPAAAARSWRIPFMLLGGGLLVTLFLLGGGALFVFTWMNGRSQPTPTAPVGTATFHDVQSTATILSVGTAALEGPPATAGLIITPLPRETNGSEEATAVNTPVLLPTLQATFTATPTRRPATATPPIAAPSVTPTATPASSGGGPPPSEEPTPVPATSTATPEF